MILPNAIMRRYVWRVLLLSFAFSSLSYADSCFPGNMCPSRPNNCGLVSWGVCMPDYFCTAGPPPPDTSGIPCYRQGACETTTGRTGCFGDCSAPTPYLPPGYGQQCMSLPNNVGQVNYGIRGCNGECSAVRPPDMQCMNGCRPQPPGVCPDTCAEIARYYCFLGQCMPASGSGGTHHDPDCSGECAAVVYGCALDGTCQPMVGGTFSASDCNRTCVPSGTRYRCVYGGCQASHWGEHLSFGCNGVCDRGDNEIPPNCRPVSPQEPAEMCSKVLDAWWRMHDHGACFDLMSEIAGVENPMTLLSNLYTSGRVQLRSVTDSAFWPGYLEYEAGTANLLPCAEANVDPSNPAANYMYIFTQSCFDALTVLHELGHFTRPDRHPMTTTIDGSQVSLVKANSANYDAEIREKCGF